MPISASFFLEMKKQKRVFSSLTAYSFPFAELIDSCGVPLVLVGDSFGMVELGETTTLPVTLENIITAGKAVKRACKQAFVAIDMPFLSVGIDVSSDMHAIKKVLQETEADGVKIEGSSPAVLATINRASSLGIPVIGHIGLTPQHIKQLGEYRVVGKSEKEADTLLQQALLVEKAGVFAVVLELISPPVAERITKVLSIPTIGIGSGSNCDGQILVLHDLLGLSPTVPRHAKPYINLRNLVIWAVGQYKDDVERGKFPL
ncbi:MAG: 3-methyl-2-oxobutanoate hydroxymethyltransferase [bacterium]